MLQKRIIFLQEKAAKAVAYLKENRVAMIAVGGVCFILLLQLIVLPLYKLNKNISQDEVAVVNQLNQVCDLVAQYDKMKAIAAGSKNSRQGVNLFAQMENLTRKLKVSGNVDFMRPSTKELDDGRKEEEVYVRFKSMLQKNFINFLYSAEIESGIVTIKSLKIKKDKHRRFNIDIIFSRING